MNVDNLVDNSVDKADNKNTEDSLCKQCGQQKTEKICTNCMVCESCE